MNFYSIDNLFLLGNIHLGYTIKVSPYEQGDTSIVVWIPCRTQTLRARSLIIYISVGGRVRQLSMIFPCCIIVSDTPPSRPYRFSTRQSRAGKKFGSASYSSIHNHSPLVLIPCTLSPSQTLITPSLSAPFTSSMTQKCVVRRGLLWNVLRSAINWN